MSPDVFVIFQKAKFKYKVEDITLYIKNFVKYNYVLQLQIFDSELFIYLEHSLSQFCMYARLDLGFLNYLEEYTTYDLKPSLILQHSF